MPTFHIAEGTRQQVRRLLLFKGDVKSLSVDLSPWADDNGTVTTATWTVESGQAILSNKTLTSNVAACLVTTTEADSGMIKLVATDGTHSEAIYIRYVTKDPQAVATDDYGFMTWQTL